MNSADEISRAFYQGGLLCRGGNLRIAAAESARGARWECRFAGAELRFGQILAVLLIPRDSMRPLSHLLSYLLAALVLLLWGCASTIRSEVTAFHHWPQAAGDKTFSFVRTPEQAQSLEHQTYEQLVREQLQKQGLREAGAGEVAPLKVEFSAGISGRDVRVVETVLVDSWYGTPWYGPGFGPGFYHPYYHPYWGYPGYGYPFYGPGWGGVPVAREQERRYTIFHRELKLKITDAANQQPVYEVTVRSDGKEGNLASLMPYLVESAFKDFPGQSGVPTVVELKMKK